MNLSLDQYRQGRSPVHALDPRVKVALALLFILSNVVLPDGAWAAFGLAWLVTLAVSGAAGLGWAYALRRSFVALPFALAAVTVLFSLPGRPLLGVQVGMAQWLITDAGLARFATIVWRSWISVQAGILLVATTSFPDLMHAFHHLRLPRLLIAIVAFMMRYLEVLVDEATRLLRAREARSARLGRRPSWLWQARVAGHMVGQLFLRSYERSDRIYQAMLARGYRGEWRTINPHVMRWTDWLAAVGMVGVLLVIQVVGWR